MEGEKSGNPVRRIREVFAGMSEESGLREYASVRGFARFVHCSESGIRDIEQKGKISRRFSQLIEMATGVSAEWLMRCPDDSEEIVGVNGLPWRGEDLDLLRLLPGLKPMLIACPSVLPAVIGKLVEMMLKEDFVEAKVVGLLHVLGLLQRRGLFERLASGQTASVDQRWHGDDLEPLIKNALGVLAPGAEELSKGQMRELEYLKSVEPRPAEDSRINELWDSFREATKKDFILRDSSLKMRARDRERIKNRPR